MAHGFSLSSRVIVINALLFTLATAALALSPATVSSRPLPSQLLVLVVGLAVMIAANSFLVRASLAPLDRLVADLERVSSTDPLERVPVPDSGIARRLAAAINDLLERIERGQREKKVAALAAQESERSRIAQELHDGVGQSLTAILLELGPLADHAPEPTAGALLRIREATREKLDEVRTVARTLRPHVLEDLGLRSALAGLTTDLFGTTGVHVQRSLDPGLHQLDAMVELVLFRVSQEALTNAARHSGAANVELTLSQCGGEVILTVADDGRGIRRGGADGTGLRGMRERSALVGGTFQVARRAHGGTVVTLAVPLESP